jgi:hypothetical protein
MSPRKRKGDAARRARKATGGAVERQQIPTGSVSEVLAALPQIGDRGPMHGPDLDVPPTIAWRTEVPRAPQSRFSDKDVDAAVAFIIATGLVEFFTTRINAGKKKPGRPARTSVLAVLVAMWLAAIDGRGMLLTKFRDILFHRISPAMQTRLGVRDTTCPTDPREALLFDRAAEASVRRTLHRMLNQIDPSIYPKNRRRPWTELHALARTLSEDEQQETQARLDWVCNQMLDAAFQTLPRAIRRQYRGSACIDATPLKLPAKGLGAESPIASADPDGGYYVRDGNHRDPSYNPYGSPSGHTFTTPGKSLWALDIGLLVAVDDHPGDRQHLPALPLAMTTDRPGVDAAGAARRLMASFVQRGYTPGYLAGDNLYSAAEESTFQTPAREVGFDLVLPYTRDYLGDQGGHESGMRLIEGGFHCPATPDALVDATKDLREGRIDLKTYKARIQERVAYRMRTKQLPIDGVGERLTCPAAGPAPLVKCANKPDSEKPRPTRQANHRHVTDARLRILPPADISGDNKPRVCGQGSIAVSPLDGAKVRQSLPYGSDQHTDLYNTLRQSQEGMHGFAKDEAHEALAAPGRRRVRGKAAQSVFAAFLLAAASIRKIRTFLANAIENPDGVIYVPRKQRKGDHARTGLPPGVGPPETAAA